MILRQAGAIFLAAVGLGLAYNASSPLGVRGSPGAEASEAPAPAMMVWLQVKPLLTSNRIVLVDARAAPAFEAGHIPGAISLPFTELARRMTAFSRRYPKTQPIVVYCASLQCPDSQAEAIALAEQYGYGDVREMPGGYAEWRLAESAAAPSEQDKR